MDRGYFALWRKFFDHPFWKEKRRFSKAEAWIDILGETQFKEEPKEVLIKGSVLYQQYGQVLRSVRGWAKRWNWSIDAVHRFLTILSKMDQIRTQNERLTTRITVVNFKKYDIRTNAEHTQCRTEPERSPNAGKSRLKKDKNVNKDTFRKPYYKPSKEEIEHSAKSKVLADIKKATDELYRNDIFPEAPKFANTMLRQKRNPRAILYALAACYMHGPFNSGNPWAYCISIIEKEDGNFNEREYGKSKT